MTSKTTSSGTLYIVATPIGNLADISQRALDTLRSVSIIAAEDTRHSKILLQHYRIQTPLLSLHEHNEAERAPELLQRLNSGASIAVIADAGTPVLSDPGFLLVRAAHEQGLKVSPIPGPSAITAALSAAGLPTDRFAFWGFLPSKKNQRRRLLQELAVISYTVVVFESAHRILATLADIDELISAQRELVLARELSKRFETFLSGTAAELLQHLITHTEQQRGEFVLLFAPIVQPPAEEELTQCLQILLTELPVKQAANLAAKLTGVKRNMAYEYALHLAQQK